MLQITYEQAERGKRITHFWVMYEGEDVHFTVSDEAIADRGGREPCFAEAERLLRLGRREFDVLSPYVDI